MLALVGFIIESGSLQDIVELPAYCAQRVERVAGILGYQGDLLSVKTGQGSVVSEDVWKFVFPGDR